jgi:chromosome segregation ATPase
MKNENDITSQIETTANLLAQLETEQADFQNRMTLAVNDADSASIISLKHRAHDLPIEIQAARIRHERLYLQRDEAKLTELKTESEMLAEPLLELREKRDKAIDEFKRASFAHQDALQNYRDRQLSISERKRAIEGLLRETPAPAPIRQSLMASGAR